MVARFPGGEVTGRCFTRNKFYESVTNVHSQELGMAKAWPSRIDLL